MTNMDEFTLFKCFKCILTCYNALIFFLGIAESIFLTKYHMFDRRLTMFDTECRTIWSWILAAAILNITVPVVTCFGLYKLCICVDDDNKKIHIINCLHIGYIVIMIWSAITYSNINASCYLFWTSNAPELWTFVIIHNIMMWIGVVILFLIVFSIAIFCCGDRCFKPITSEIPSLHVRTNNFDAINDINAYLNSYGSIRKIDANDII